MLNDSAVVTALIAGAVSLLVSGTSGLHTVVQSRKKLDSLRKELIAKGSAEAFIVGKRNYLIAYRGFERTLVNVNEQNPNDATAAIQLLINFYAENAKDFYLDNKQILQSEALDKLLRMISAAANSGALNDSSHGKKIEFGNNIMKFCSELYERSLMMS